MCTHANFFFFFWGGDDHQSYLSVTSAQPYLKLLQAFNLEKFVSKTFNSSVGTVDNRRTETSEELARPRNSQVRPVQHEIQGRPGPGATGSQLSDFRRRKGKKLPKFIIIIIYILNVRILLKLGKNSGTLKENAIEK